MQLLRSTKDYIMTFFMNFALHATCTYELCITCYMYIWPSIFRKLVWSWAL